MTLEEAADRLFQMANAEHQKAYRALQVGGSFTEHLDRGYELREMFDAVDGALELIQGMNQVEQP